MSRNIVRGFKKSRGYVRDIDIGLGKEGRGGTERIKRWGTYMRGKKKS
jgi:hypothetical protein